MNLKPFLLSALVAAGASASSHARVIAVEKPAMEIFLPDSASTGRAVLVLPGGGYAMVAYEHEGTAWASLFNSLGITAAVLRYELPDGEDRMRPLHSALAALQWLHDHAAELGINPADIGIMGFSAGGHLAATMATQAPEALRPAWQALFYPVISMRPALTHAGSRRNLLGADPTEADDARFSADERVDALTPRAFIALSADDAGVRPANSIAYWQALDAAGKSASLHIYPTGGHGWGFNPGFVWHDLVTAELSAWLKSF